MKLFYDKLKPTVQLGTQLNYHLSTCCNYCNSWAGSHIHFVNVFLGRPTLDLLSFESHILAKGTVSFKPFYIRKGHVYVAFFLQLTF